MSPPQATNISESEENILLRKFELWTLACESLHSRCVRRCKDLAHGQTTTSYGFCESANSYLVRLMGMGFPSRAKS